LAGGDDLLALYNTCPAAGREVRVLAQTLNQSIMNFFRQFYLSGVVLAIGMQGVKAQSASFNFTAAAATVTGWTNIAGDPSKAVRTGTASSGVTISSVAITNWYPDPNGNECAFNGGGAAGGIFFPAAVMINHWYVYGTTSASTIVMSQPQLIIGGLHADSNYTIRVSGSFADGVPSPYNMDPTEYTVTGAANYGTLAINGNYNTTDGAIFSNVVPDSTGKIHLYLSTANGSTVATLSGLQIAAGSAPVFWSTRGNLATAGDSSFLGTLDSNRLPFRTKNLERMSILPTGNIGIGTKTPTAQLHTTGTVRLAGLSNDSTQSDGRVLVSDTSGNLYYRNIGSAALTAGAGLSETAGGIALGDSIAGNGPHSFTSNRYQYLNGHQYSIGGSVNDPVNHPVFRMYDNGDLAAGTTTDTTVNTSNQTGLRYYAKSGYVEIGASDRIDTALSPIAYGIWPTSGIIINSDEPNTIKGKIMNTVFVADLSIIDSGIWMENNFIAGEENHFSGATNTYIRSFLGGYHNAWSASIDACVIDGHLLTISKPLNSDMIVCYQCTGADTSGGSLVGGLYNQFGGYGQLVSGWGLVNRTPMGTVLGNYNVDFSSLNYTGMRGVTAPGISGYPLFALGNASANSGAVHSNAFTVLYNGRTQINTSGFSNSLTQANVTPQAALDIVSTNTGVLLPRLNSVQRNAIASGDLQNGLLLYNTDSSAFQYYNGSAWNSVGTGSGSSRWQFSGASIFDSADNIAIGTSNPQGYKLAVNGSAVFTRVVVKPRANWPDYVFKKGYVLPRLVELDRYIHIHHHLPGIGSEREIRQNGIDIGEQQGVLLKKVEELTLYLIRENQSLSDQNRRVADQARQIVAQGVQLEEDHARLEAQQKEIDELKKMILER
jgi:hypothetical protein